MFLKENDTESPKFSVIDYTKLCENKEAYIEFFTKFVINVSQCRMKQVKTILENNLLEIDRKITASDEAFILMVLWNEDLMRDSGDIENENSQDDRSTDSGNKTIATATSTVSHCKQKKNKGTGNCGWDEEAIQFYNEKKNIIAIMRSDIHGRRRVLELIKLSIEGQDISSLLTEDPQEDTQVTMDNSNSLQDESDVLDSFMMIADV